MNAVIPVDSCSPVAYENVFEEGDRWERVRGCAACPVEERAHCCGGCKMFIAETGDCQLHDARDRRKPLYCVVQPLPTSTNSRCSLEFHCVRGSRRGTLRRLCVPLPEDGLPGTSALRGEVTA